MGNAPTVGYYHFDAWDLPTKYGWMHSGAGSRAAIEIQDIVDRMAERMITSGDVPIVVGFAGARAASLY